MPLALPPQLQLSAATVRLLGKLVLWLAVIGLLLFTGYRAGSRHWREKYTEAVTAHAAVLGELAGKARASQQAVDAALADFKTKDKARTDAHEKAVSDAYERGEAVGRAVVAGDRQLRQDWAVCPARPPAWDGALVGQGDPAELGRRAVAVGRVLGKAGEWDADYKRVYDALIDTRALLSQCYGAPAQ